MNATTRQDWPTEKRYLQLAWGMLAIACLVNLGVQPLYLEEPRRAMIALEMWQNGNLWVPTQMGAYYYNKPPLFNWVLNVMYGIGGQSEFWLRLPTVLSIFGMAALTGRVVARHLDERTGWYAASLSLLCGAWLFYFGVLAEIDLFFSLLTLGAFWALFHFGQTGKWLLAFGLFYLLHALGVLTKGLPSFLFAGLSVLAWLIYTREWRRLFSAAHLLGVALFLAVVGGFLAIYLRQLPNPNEFLMTIWGQSAERTVLEQGGSGFLQHIINFPVQALLDVLPGGLLLLFGLSAKNRRGWSEQALLRFILLMAAVNLPVYWLSPGAKMRYVYMFYPMLLVFPAWWYVRQAERADHDKLGRVLRLIFIGLLAVIGLGVWAIPFVDELSFLEGRWLITPLLSILALSSGVVFWRQPKMLLPLIIVATAIVRLAFGLIVLPQRAHDSDAQKKKEVAEQIFALTQNEPLEIIVSDPDERISFTTVIYLDFLREQYLRQQTVEAGAKPSFVTGQYYLLQEKWLPAGADWPKLGTYEHRGRYFYLIQAE